MHRAQHVQVGLKRLSIGRHGVEHIIAEETQALAAWKPAETLQLQYDIRIDLLLPCPDFVHIVSVDIAD
jgi:hypothetical protein